VSPCGQRRLAILDFSIWATLYTINGLAIPLEGKAGVDCSHQRLFVLSVAET